MKSWARKELIYPVSYAKCCQQRVQSSPFRRPFSAFLSRPTFTNIWFDKYNPIWMTKSFDILTSLQAVMKSVDIWWRGRPLTRWWRLGFRDEPSEKEEPGTWDKREPGSPASSNSRLRLAFMSPFSSWSSFLRFNLSSVLIREGKDDGVERCGWAAQIASRASILVP